MDYLEPIVKDDDVHGMWWFYDETWANQHGPFETYEEAGRHYNRYCHWLETGEILDEHCS